MERRVIHTACRENAAIARVFDEMIDEIIEERNGDNHLASMKAWVSLANSFSKKFFSPGDETEWACECDECSKVIE